MQVEGCTCLIHRPLPAPETSRGFAHEPVGSALIKPPQLQCGNTQTTIVYTRTFSTSYNFFWIWTGPSIPQIGAIQCIHPQAKSCRTFSLKLPGCIDFRLVNRAILTSLIPCRPPPCDTVLRMPFSEELLPPWQF